MAQEFYSSIPDGQTSVKQDNILSRKNELTLRSNFSGTSFPESPAIGQHCYREDMNGKEFVYTQTGWQEATDLSTVGKDIALARSGFASLADKLKISIDDDGSLKNPTTANVSEWKTLASTPNYVSSTQFWIEGDKSPILTQGRGVKCILGLQVVYTSVASSEYDSVNDKTFVNTNSSVLTNALSGVEYGIIQYSLGSIASKTEVNTAIGTHNTNETAHEDIRTAIAEATKKAGLPVGHTYTVDYTELQAGQIPLLGGKYLKSTYADLWAWVQTHPSMIVTEEQWQTLKMASGGRAVAKYANVDDTHFRVPLVTTWVRGASSVDEVGVVLEAGLPNITATAKGQYTSGGYAEIAREATGAFESKTDGVTRNYTSTMSGESNMLIFNASKSNSIYGKSTTVQPQSIVRLWVVQAFGTTSNVGNMDVAQVAQGVTDLTSRVSTLEADSDFTIIYPNGGSKETPANVTVNSRYECDNPFSGYFVDCIAEIQVNGKWGAVQGTVRDGSGNYIGFGCCQYGNSGEKIVLQTAQNYLCAGSVGDGNPFGSVNITTAPCRIRVRKAGKVTT